MRSAYPRANHFHCTFPSTFVEEVSLSEVWAALTATLDFGQEWLELSPDNFAFAAWEIMQKMKNQLGIHIQHVIVTSDNQDPGWM
jgi:hypothetical protein